MPHERVYRQGKLLTSVTQIPAVIGKPFLDQWHIKLCNCVTHQMAKKTPYKPAEQEAITRLGLGHCGFVYGDAVKDDAAELGNQVHELIDYWLKGQQPEAKQYLNEAAKWTDKVIELYKEHGVKSHVVQPEKTLIDEESGLNGSPDHPILYDGQPCIADLKIKNQLDKFTGVQGWLYRYLIRRLYKFDFRYMLAVWCKKEKPYEVEPVLIDLDEWGEVSKACVSIWNKLNPKRIVTIYDDASMGSEVR